MWEGERKGSGMVTAAGRTGVGGAGPGEGACEPSEAGRLGSALLSRWRALGPAVGLPRGLKILSSAELFSRCLSAVTASAGPGQALESQVALLAAQEAGTGSPEALGESPPLACSQASGRAGTGTVPAPALLPTSGRPEAGPPDSAWRRLAPCAG